MVGTHNKTGVSSFVEGSPLPCRRDPISRTCRIVAGKTVKKQKGSHWFGIVFCIFWGMCEGTVSTRLNLLSGVTYHAYHA